MATCLRNIDQLAREPAFAYVVTPNVDHVVRLYADANGGQLWQSYSKADLCLCDSRILQRLAQWSGLYLRLVPGSDLTKVLIESWAPKFERVAVVGGDRDLIQSLARVYPTIEWIQHIPPMGVRNNPSARAAIVDFVERCPANVYLFAIGSPQSELLCGELAHRQTSKGVALCIGASLEFIAGSKMRAPLWMQKLSLEWLFRLASEPLRLWRRYLVQGPAIFRIWWDWHVKASRLS
jgi:exopolysaccharide biosynthesis WecB/TagA/CpsF family protein